MTTISINLNKSRAYDILVGRDNLDTIGTQLKSMDIGESIFIITDLKVGGLYAKRLIDIFQKAGFPDTDLAIFPEGEKSKNIKTYTELTRLSKFDGKWMLLIANFTSANLHLARTCVGIASLRKFVLLLTALLTKERRYFCVTSCVRG